MLVDDLLLAPFRGLLWVFEQVHDAAQEEIAGEAAAITEELRQLHMMLEAGQITEVEFDAFEQKLLDQLEAAQARQVDHAEDLEPDGPDGPDGEDGEDDDVDGAPDSEPEDK